MEEELCYSTVSFKSFDNDKSAVPEYVESALYAEVKGGISASKNLPEITAPECSGLPACDCIDASEEKSMKSSISPAYRRAAVILGLLCFLLFAVLTALSIFSYIYRSKYNNIQAEKEMLEQDRARLKTLSEQMNSTLDAILQKSSFSPQQYCHSREEGLQCSSCPQNWIQNGSSCYFFSTGDDWKTWEQSQEYCLMYGGQLTDIDSVEEQAFINQHIKYYYDKYHGYWIGLSEKKNKWIWTTGAILNMTFWIEIPYQGYKYCVLSMPSDNPMKSWTSNSCSMKSKWICEVEAFPWPSFLKIHQNLSDPLK
ncbi:C-type lectin domain family 9 member A isoform X2 [Danio aesculapii]|uniref:C-type lectin domain family 9 member A isoform X2 n=1 Tax=Danio aesculapii TaxID=1142201 RepID=UPI0024BFCBF2|nr:C-type lectin domain family 9 member A isoform X2 [Danio aesculapii]